MTYPDLAMVIPVWFTEAVSRATVRDRLRQTLEGVGQYVEPGKVALVTDGDDRSAEILSSSLPGFNRRFGQPFRLLVNEENAGKGSALTSGLRVLLREADFSYVLFRDGDGDHYIGDVEHLYRYMQWMRRQGVRGELVVIGRRAELHRSIGWIRGEFEELLNRVTIAALTRRLAVEDRVLVLRFLSACLEPPDLMSGYKLCSHGIGRMMAERNWQGCLPVSAVDMYRYGMERIPLLEGGLEGAAIGEVLRLVGMTGR